MDRKFLEADELGVRLEAKDLEIGPQFYLAHGVKDVVVFNPYTLAVLHVRCDDASHLISPVKIELECGCELTV